MQTDDIVGILEKALLSPKKENKAENVEILSDLREETASNCLSHRQQTEFRKSQLLEAQLKEFEKEMDSKMDETNRKGIEDFGDSDSSKSVGRTKSSNSQEEKNKALMEFLDQSLNMSNIPHIRNREEEELGLEYSAPSPSSPLDKAFIGSKSLSALNYTLTIKDPKPSHILIKNHTQSKNLLNNSKIIHKLSSKIHKDLSALSLSQREKLVFSYIHGSNLTEESNDVKLEDLLRVSGSSLCDERNSRVSHRERAKEHNVNHHHHNHNKNNPSSRNHNHKHMEREGKENRRKALGVVHQFRRFRKEEHQHRPKGLAAPNTNASECSNPKHSYRYYVLSSIYLCFV